MVQKRNEEIRYCLVRNLDKEIAPLLLSVDHPLALADNKHVREFALIVIGPFLSNLYARVEESGLTSAKGADAGGEGSSHHGCG